MIEVGDKAPDSTLLDSRGEQVTLSSLWRERPLVVVFLRHFG